MPSRYNIDLVGFLFLLFAFAKGNYLTVNNYYTLNLIGALILAVFAFSSGLWGFTAASVVWAYLAFKKLWERNVG